MRDWDPGASTALHECKQALEERDIVRWLREVTRAMWRPNAERYEPSHLFDTPRGVAGLAAENLRERMLAEYRAVSSPWRTRGIRLSVPHGSLLIEVGELAVHVVKAPGVQLREPEWTTFAWAAGASPPLPPPPRTPPQPRAPHPRPRPFFPAPATHRGAARLRVRVRGRS